MSHPLEDPWPPFLDWIRAGDKATRDRGLVAFWKFTHSLVAAFPPRAFASLTRVDREDVLSRVFLKCATGRLLTYRNMGNPFGSWLAAVIRREAYPVPPPPSSPLPEPTVEERPLSRLLPRHVQDCLEVQPVHYRRVLRWMAEGLKPREVTILMPGPEKWDNVRVGNLFHAARRSMRMCLEEKGLSKADLV